MRATAWRLLGLGLPLVLAGATPTQPGRPVAISPEERTFLQQHWRRPIPPQGEPPEAFSAVERSLHPVDCGSCHVAQFEDWKTSIHARSMGPGISGQLVELRESEPATARSCPACHAPLAEQADQTAGPAGGTLNPAYDATLREQGLVCAGCHIRAHRRYGPPRRDGTSPNAANRAAMPHGGFTASRAFLRSEFCASCHQFTPDGLTLNGKPVENTFEEWRSSPAAKRGLQCQDCHMPDRRHLWRGIHDAEMVKSGVRISFRTSRARYRPGEEVDAALTVTNTGVGHYFPTYVTPRVVLRIELTTASGESLPSSAREQAIAREVPLDLSREISDTRIAPGGQFTFRYRHALDRSAVSLRATVTVFPDHFYTGFFEALLENGAGAGEARIREALEATRRSPFIIFNRDIPLT